MAGMKSTIALIVINAAAFTMDTPAEDEVGFSATVAVVTGLLWLVYICLVMVDQLLSAMFPGDQDEDEQEEAYQQRAANVEMAAREIAAQAKKKQGGGGGMGGG